MVNHLRKYIIIYPSQNPPISNHLFKIIFHFKIFTFYNSFSKIEIYQLQILEKRDI